jgi:[acyl-carrier-protein] S-malonyltransferase
VTVAWLFAGQGAQTPRMGLALAARFPAARALLDRASELLDVDVVRLLTRGGKSLERTDVLQPVMTAVTLGASEALRACGCAPDLVAGHSLGEIAACAAAGALKPADAISLARERGRGMAEAATLTPGGLLALTGCDEACVDAALERGRARGMIVLGAHNAPDEWVLSGEESAVRAVAETTPSTRLRVSGPWHSPAMELAAARLRDRARNVQARAFDVPLVLGMTGDVAPQSADLAELVAAALLRPVAWTRVMATLRARGVHKVVTCGPGKVLASLSRRNLGPTLRTLGTETPDEIERTVAELGHEA